MAESQYMYCSITVTFSGAIEVITGSAKVSWIFEEPNGGGEQRKLCVTSAVDL